MLIQGGGAYLVFLDVKAIEVKRGKRKGEISAKYTAMMNDKKLAEILLEKLEEKEDIVNIQ